MNNPTEMKKDFTQEEKQLREAQQMQIEALRQKLEERMNSSKSDVAWAALIKAYRSLKDAKPGDRSEKDRRYAVAITKMEDVLSWFNSMIGHGGFE